MLNPPTNVSELTGPAKDAALSAFASWVSTIADNVNNPIASILAGVAIVERELNRGRSSGDCDDAVVDESLDRIKHRLRQLSEYVSELMNFSKPDQVNVASVDVRAAFAAVRREVQIPEGVRATFTVAKGAESVQADPARLRVALRCLTLNALEAAAPSTAPAIAVGAKLAEGRQRAGYEFVIEDNGPGFTHTALHRVGEPFFSTKEAGTGLGLAIVKKFVIAHGGSVTFGTSPSLGGGLVTVFLPSPKLQK